MFIAGIDIAKRSRVAHIINSEGRTVVKPFSIRKSCSGCNALLARINKITNRKSELILAMESAAHDWLALYTRLCQEGCRVVLNCYLFSELCAEFWLIFQNQSAVLSRSTILCFSRF